MGGEARRRQDLGLPPKTVRCPIPSCRSRQIRTFAADSDFSTTLARLWGGVASTTYQQCLTCNAFWEALPPGWRTDCVDRAKTMGPCDNCAYRASSKETADPEERAKIHGLAQDLDEHGYPKRGRFSCHKGIPIKVDEAALTIEYDFAAAGIDPGENSCAGFLRILWASNRERRESRS